MARLALNYGSTTLNREETPLSLSLGKNFRLPRTVLPKAYRAELAVDLQHDSFEGTVAIDVALSGPAAQVHLHAVGLTVTAARAEMAGASHDARPETDEQSETVTLTFSSPLPGGTATLHLS